MVTAIIFAPEISSLESQVAELQAQITATQSQITVLGEADAVASGALQALQNAVTKISGLAPSALATLKAAALNLFQGGDDNQDNGGGNQPIAPLPSSNGNGHNHKPEAVLGQDIVLISSSELVQHLQEQVSEIAPELNGQTCEINPQLYWDTADPDGSSWEFTSSREMFLHKSDSLHQYSDLSHPTSEGNKCCPIYADNVVRLQTFLEDAPSSALQGQAVKIACPVPEVEQKPHYIKLVKLSDAVAYQRKHNGEIPTAYIGFRRNGTDLSRNATGSKTW